MTFSSESEVEILRLAFNEEWPIGTIAKQLGIHRSIVARVIAQSQELSTTKIERSKFVENHLEFLTETIKKYPDIHASRLFSMVKKRGYEGRSQSYFRKIISDIRPQKTQEAFARLTTLPGEQAQVDWADFGRVSVGKASHKLMAFVMTLSWSRTVFVRFFFLPACPFFSKALWMHLNFLAACPELFYMTI